MKEVIRAQAELEVATILAEADKTARVTRGEAMQKRRKFILKRTRKILSSSAFVRS